MTLFCVQNQIQTFPDCKCQDKGCNRAQQAVLDADTLVIGVGQHFTSKLFQAPMDRQHRVYAFFSGNFNRTLSSLSVLRAAHG